MGAFVFPNQEIPDDSDLRSFIVPGKRKPRWKRGENAIADLDAVEMVERAAGLQLFNPELKGRSRQLCAVTQCQVLVRRFNDTRKQLGGQGRGADQAKRR